MHVNHSSVSHNLMSSLQDDLKCFNEVETLLLQLPEAICDVNPRHLMYIQRDYCWNGTAFGRYIVTVWETHLCHIILGRFLICTLGYFGQMFQMCLQKN
jgi:hypothetical protein